MKNALKKSGLILLGAALLAGVLTACSTAPTATALTITDQLGRTVTINNTHPQKIISLAPSNTEILFALGLGDRIVGVTTYCNYPPEATTKPSIGDYNTPNLEEIVAKEPDLVLATEVHETSLIPQLEAQGITVVGLSPKTIDEVMDSITLVGQITGQEDEAASLVDDMQKRINAIKEKTSALSEAQRPRVFYIIWHDPIWTTGNNTFADALIQISGGINIASELDGYVDISLEAVIAGNPEVIIAGVGMGTGEDLPLQYVKEEPRLKDIEARQNDRIYSVNLDTVGRPGPRIVDALEDFFRLIHPELE